jgi:hypothetical protein
LKLAKRRGFAAVLGTVFIASMAASGAFAQAQPAPAAPPSVDLPQAAPASGGRGGQGMAACRIDAATYCAGVEAGRGRRVACLRQNLDKLTPDCRASLAARSDRVGAPASSAIDRVPVEQGQAAPGPNAAPAPASSDSLGSRPRLGAACRTDIATFCVGQDRGGRQRCLVEHRTQLSPQCAAALDQVRSIREAMRAACAADAQTLCASATRGEIGKCLNDNVTKVSPTCAEALASSRPKGRRAAIDANRQPVRGLQ